MNQLVAFDFESQNVRVVIGQNGEPWFIASDVASALAYQAAKDMTRFIDEDEKGRHIVPTPGGDQDMLVINEAGLYSAILKSRKPEAKRFKRWVTHEVLPSIRKTGSYMSAGSMTALTTPTQDKVTAILSIGEAIAKVPGVKPGIAMAATLTVIHENTGLSVESLLTDYSKKVKSRK